jgi:hypothetical protein
MIPDYLGAENPDPSSMIGPDPMTSMNPMNPDLMDQQVPEPDPNDEVIDTTAAEAKVVELSPAEIKKIILDIVKDVEREEQGYRSVQLQVLRKLDLFWHGIQRLYWSESANDFRSLQDIEDLDLKEELEGLNEVVNIYRAHGESIIAALSTGIPNVQFSPANADSALDLLTSKAYSRIAELVQKRNKASLLFIKALFTLWNQNFVAAYHYSKQDKKFGVYLKHDTITKEVEIPIVECLDCGEEQPDGQGLTDPNLGQNLDELGMPIPAQCVLCGSMGLFPSTKMTTEEVPVEEEVVKSSQEIEIYGPLNVLIQNNARTIQDTGVVLLYTENDLARVLSTFPELAKKINGEPDSEEDAQVRATHTSQFETNTVTVKQCWLRPWMFWRLGAAKVDEIKTLYNLYPTGVFATIVQDEVVELHNEDVDDHWTFTESPVSRTIISDPMGSGLVSIQETINDLYSLSKETVRHGVPETFYDQNLIDGDKYQQVQAKPGMLFPVRKQSGQSIAESFFQFKSATLSKEVDTFRARNDADAQFVTGAFPSIYGGPNEGSSGTLGEYALSKNMALQRLRITYKMLTEWWATIMSKVVPDFAQNMMEDETFTKKQGGSFINVVIKKEEAESGKIGLVEVENSEQIPISWAQKKDMITQLIQFNNEQINFALFHPENANTTAELLGFPDFYVPGEEDRTKQLIEISQLLRGQPTQSQPDPMNPQVAPQMLPSVMIDIEVDEKAVHIEVCRAWAKSSAGLEAKQENPGGYQNVLLHLRMHLTTPTLEEQMQMQNNQNQNQSQSQQGNQEKTKSDSRKNPENTPEPRPVE